MTCLGPYEMFLFFQPCVLLLPYSVLACLIIWKDKSKFNLFLQQPYVFFLSEIMCCVFLRYNYF